METPYLHRADKSKEFYTSERCHILELINNHDENKPLSIARARVEPNQTTAWHRLKELTEYYYILQGSGIMEINEGNQFVVKENDIIEIPPNSSQRITNDGVEDLVFLAICSPPFTSGQYEELE